MGVAEIIALLVQGTSAVKTAVETYEQIKYTLSKEDQASIHAALIEAQAETDRLRPLVDAALEAASKN